jgi:hypothetical protein
VEKAGKRENMREDKQFVSKSRKIKDNIEEFVGQLFMWSCVAAAFIFLQSFFAKFLHWIFYLPLCVILSIPIGFSVVIGITAFLNFIKAACKSDKL